MIGARLTMLAIVMRPLAGGKDRWQQPLAAGFAPGVEVRCFIWSNTSREIVDGDKTAMIEDLRGLFPRGTDLAEGHEIKRVTNRRGTVIIPGNLRVEGPVQFKHSHLEVALRRVG